MPSAIGIGSHLIFVLLSAELSRDLNDSFLWKFCCSYVARDEEKVRDGVETRAYRCVGAWSRGRVGARMSWREQEDAMVISYALATTKLVISTCMRSSGDTMKPKMSRGENQPPRLANDVSTDRV